MSPEGDGETNRRFQFHLLPKPGGGSARRGRLRTPHGSAETPAFMPVGTAASIKAADPEQVRATGAEVVLCNTYHLALRPGDDVVRDLGGLHSFMGWSGPILTDSGGYQVFSLAELTSVDRDGVTFRNHIDGRHLRLGPERAMEIQTNLGSDVIMVFDECLPRDASRSDVSESLWERTLPWAERCWELHPEGGRAVFAIGQGGLFEDCRVACLQELSRLPFDGFAVGGLSVGESPEDFRRVLAVSTEHLPEDRPRYLMGVGSVPEILDAVHLGIDMFDCVLPTRNARNGQVLTFEGPVNLKNARFTRDPNVIDPDCNCPACARGFSRAYLRHLFMAKEILGMTLGTLHNLTFMQRFMHRIRTSIERGNYDDFRRECLARFARDAESSEPSRF